MAKKLQLLSPLIGPQGEQGYGLFLCAADFPSQTAITLDVSKTFFSMPSGYTLRVGDKAIGKNGYLATIMSINGDSVTVSSNGICIKGADGEKGVTGEQGPQGETGATGEQGNLIMPVALNMPTHTGETATVMSAGPWHLPDGYTLRVGDFGIGTNGYYGMVIAVDGSSATVRATGLKITSSLTTETWTFELEGGTTVTKAVYVG